MEHSTAGLLVVGALDWQQWTNGAQHSRTAGCECLWQQWTHGAQHSRTAGCGCLRLTTVDTWSTAQQDCWLWVPLTTVDTWSTAGLLAVGALHWQQWTHGAQYSRTAGCGCLWQQWTHGAQQDCWLWVPYTDNSGHMEQTTAGLPDLVVSLTTVDMYQ